MLFAHETQSFTPWLRDNLDRLSGEIGVRLRAIETNVVGDGQIADLLARDERDGSLAVIESQLEVANFEHFGRMLAYAASIHARSVIWIAPRFEAPHLAAAAWLNQMSGPSVDFYAIKVSAVRVGASAPAVIFQTLEGPNALPTGAKGAPVAIEGFATGFWSAHLARFPDEAKLSRPVGQRCRWRSTCIRGAVIGLLVEEQAATVFLRGRDGIVIGHVERTLAPYADRMKSQLGVPLRGDRVGMLAAKSLAINITHPSNWQLVSAWLRAQADAYDDCLKEVVGHGADARRRGGRLLLQ